MLLIMLIFWLCIAWLTAYFASQKGRKFLDWFIVGLIIGVFGLLIALIIKPIQPTVVNNNINNSSPENASKE